MDEVCSVHLILALTLTPLACCSQPQHLHLGSRSLLSCRVHELWRFIRRPLHPWNVRGIHHRRIFDRELHVLHSDGADSKGWVLV